MGKVLLAVLLTLWQACAVYHLNTMVSAPASLEPLGSER